MVGSAEPLSGFRISRAFESCGRSGRSSTPGADGEETPVEVPEMDAVIGGGRARACIVRIRHIAIRI